MSETTIQTACVQDGGFSWNTEDDQCFRYSVGKQRTKVILGGDIVASFADHFLSQKREHILNAMDGWKKNLDSIAKDISLTEAQAKRKRSDAEKELARLEEKMDILDDFKLDDYLYDVVRTVFLADAEFGQMTHLLKKSISDRKGRKENDLLVNDWRTINGAIEDDGGPILGVRMPIRCSDLMASAWELIGGEKKGLNKDRFIEGRIIPLLWLLERFMSTEALEIEMGQMALRASRMLAEWERDLNDDLRQLHRDAIRRACLVKCLIDSIDLDRGPKKSTMFLTLREDFLASFMSSFREYRELADRLNRSREMDRAGLVVVGMGGSGKTTFLRRCYDVLREDYGNGGLTEDIDPKSTAFVVGHMFKDIEVPLFSSSKKRLTLCWMDTAGSEDYRLLGQQLTISVREMRRKMFLDDPADYNLLFVWSCEPSYDLVKDLHGFEDVFIRFLEEVQNLAFFELELPNKIFLLLNKADNAEKAGIVGQFKSDHERCFLAAIDEHGEGLSGESLGFLSTLHVDRSEISRKLLMAVFGTSDEDRRKAFTGIRLGINQGVIGNLLPGEDAQRFKEEVYDAHGTKVPEDYFAATMAWIDSYMLGSGKERSALTRALLLSLRSFLGEMREGDEVA